MQTGKSLARLAYKWILQARLYHLFFWLVYTLFFALAVQPGHNPREWVLYSGLILSLHGVVAYFNNYYLVNRYLYSRQYLTYVVLLALSVVAAIFPISIIVHNVINNKELKSIVWSWDFVLIIGLSVLFTVVLSMVLKLLKNWYSEEQLNKQLQQINLQTELKFLKSQINPHFLFNSLNNLYALTLTKSDQAPEVVLRLSNILRYVLYETADGPVPLEKEVRYLEDYIDLERIRVGSRVDIRFETQGHFGNWLIEPMLFLTFVENSFKHGVSAAIEHGWVHIHMAEHNGTLDFDIENSKADVAAGASHGPGGIGLENLRKRLDLSYAGRYQLNLTETPQAYKVHLTLQL
ncbi:MAG: histidine kinase [Bacteroidetes bacterium]|nr:histidine kinase [Bacteroidota bacterium]